MTKVADKIVYAADSGVKGVMAGVGKTNAKIKKIIKRPVDKDADGWNKTAQVSGKVISVGGNVAADTILLSSALLLRLSQIFVIASDWLLADNQILDWMQKKNASKKVKINKKTGKDKKLSKFTRENPRIAAYLTWYLMLMTAIGGIGVGKNKDRIVDAVKDKIENVKDALRIPLSKEQKQEKENINTVKIDPRADKEQWMAQIDAIWPYIYMETVLSEGFVNEAYADVGETGGYITIGSGYMIGRAKPKGDRDRALIKERKAFFQKVLGKPYTNGVSVSFDENRRLVRAFYEKYVWPYIKKNFNTPIDAHMFIELGIGMYNRGSGIYQNGYDGSGIRNAINDSLAVVDVVNNFDDLCKSGNGGLRPKYGVAAHRVLGNITDSVVLHSYANSVYGLNSEKLWKNGELKDYPNVASDLMGVKTADITKNGKTYRQLRLHEYLSPEEVAIITNGGLFKDFVLQPQQVIKNQESSAEKLNEQGEKLYVDGNYQDAIKKYEQAIKENPRYYIVYSNMVIAYYQLGEYNQGISIVNNAINLPDFNSATKEIKGYTYFNGALCYEKLGDNEQDGVKKLDYYNKASEYASKGEKIAETNYRILKARLNDKISKIQRSKAIAFNNASVLVKNKMHKTSVMYNTKQDEHQA